MQSPRAALDALSERVGDVFRAGGKVRRIDGKIIRNVELGLTLALAAALLFFLFKLLAPLPEPVTDPLPPQLRAAEGPSAPVNPFRVTASAPGEAAAIETAATLNETSLSLTLHGTWVDADGGAAIIASGSDSQKRYKAGEEVAPGVKLEMVEREFVVLDRGGAKESLRLLNRQQGAAPAASAAIAPAASNDSVDYEGLARIGEAVMIVPQEDGAGGVKLSLQPGRNISIFARAGLRAGDILVSIDNQPIGSDIASALERIATMGSRASINISVERDGVVMPMSIPTKSVSEGLKAQ